MGTDGAAQLPAKFRLEIVAERSEAEEASQSDAVPEENQRNAHNTLSFEQVTMPWH